MSERRMKQIRKIYRLNENVYDEIAGKHPRGGFKNGYTLLKKVNDTCRNTNMPVDLVRR